MRVRVGACMCMCVCVCVCVAPHQTLSEAVMHPWHYHCLPLHVYITLYEMTQCWVVSYSVCMREGRRGLAVSCEMSSPLTLPRLFLTPSVYWDAFSHFPAYYLILYSFRNSCGGQSNTDSGH